MQSRTLPKWASLPEGHLLVPAQVRPLDPVPESIEPGKRFAFRLPANPTRLCTHPGRVASGIGRAPRVRHTGNRTRPAKTTRIGIIRCRKRLALDLGFDSLGAHHRNSEVDGQRPRRLVCGWSCSPGVGTISHIVQVRREANTLRDTASNLFP